MGFVGLETNLAGFKQIVSGEFDNLPENVFYMVGDVSQVQDKAREMAARLDTTVTKAGSEKRDVDYVHEYQTLLAELREARAEAEDKGETFDSFPVLEKIHKQMGIDQYYTLTREKTMKF